MSKASGGPRLTTPTLFLGWSVCLFLPRNSCPSGSLGGPAGCNVQRLGSYSMLSPLQADSWLLPWAVVRGQLAPCPFLEIVFHSGVLVWAQHQPRLLSQKHGIIQTGQHYLSLFPSSFDVAVHLFCELVSSVVWVISCGCCKSRCPVLTVPPTQC